MIGSVCRRVLFGVFLPGKRKSRRYRRPYPSNAFR